MFPVWRESLRLSPVESLSQSIQITIKDATKCGDTVIIGICTLPISNLLNQATQNVWIPLNPPHGKKKNLMWLFILLYFIVESTLTHMIEIDE